MAQEIQVVLHCDRCLRDGFRTAQADTVTVVIDGQARKVELCDQCGKELVEPLRDALDIYGRPAGDSAPVVDGPAGRDPRARDCPVPGCPEATPKLRQHVRMAHGDAAEKQYLPPLPRYRCPEPDCPRGVPGRELAGTVGLAVHGRQSHGLRGPVSDYIRRHGLSPLGEATRSGDAPQPRQAPTVVGAGAVP
jgi:hypothetical protein